MQRRSAIAFGVAIFLGLIAVYLSNSYLTASQQAQSKTSSEVVQLAVARVPLEYGAVVSPDKIQFVSWPADSVPQGAFRTTAEVSPAGSSHVVLRRIEAGEPVLRSKLSGEGGRATLSALLPPEMRAVAIRISDVAGVAGFVLPGDRVDVLITREGQSGQLADILLQDVRVIAIDQDANDSSDKPTLGKTATLEVSQYDAQKLALGQTVGSLSLALRSVRAEQGAAYTQAVDVRSLSPGERRARIIPVTYSAATRPSRPRQMAAASPAARPPAPAAGKQVEVVRGTTRNDYEVGAYRGE
jgi:pilus assembly protein CpaB